MKSKIGFGIVALAMVVSQAMVVSAASHGDYKVEDRAPIQHVFSGDHTLDSNTVNGSVTVIGDGGTTMRVEGERIIRAADAAEIARAKKEVTLDINEKDGVAQLYENGPFRSNDHASESHGFHEDSERHYEVTFNLTIHVPHSSGLRLRTVNGGVQVQDTSGTFDVKSVNGAVAMTNIAGSGSADAVNGATTVSFRENPKSDSSFTSVNGRVEIAFQPNLSGDFSFRTVNGSIFTDFEATALASMNSGEKIDGKFVYKSKGISQVRIGAGGPHFRLETVNGSILVKKAK